MDGYAGLVQLRAWLAEGAPVGLSDDAWGGHGHLQLPVGLHRAGWGRVPHRAPPSQLHHLFKFGAGQARSLAAETLSSFDAE